MRMRVTLAILTALSFAAVQHGFSDEKSAREMGTCYVLLQNGNVLHGALQESGNRIALTVGGNTKIYLELKQIEFIGSSLETLYQHQCAGIQIWGAGEHWHLAHWCIQQGLLDHAIKHYKAVESLAGDTPRFKELDHLLREALLKHTKTEPQKHGPENESKSTVDNQVVFASGSSQDATEAKVASRKKGVESTQDLPSYVRRSFHTSVVPILVSRCGQSGCHGLMGRTEFHVYQPVGEQAASILAKDLEEVLRYVDRDRPEESPLLSYATKAHGIHRNPSFSLSREEDRMHLDKITQWLKSLVVAPSNMTSMPAQFPSNTSATPIQNKENSGTASSKPTARFSEEKQDRNAKLSKPPKSGSPAIFLTGSEISDLEEMIDRLEKKQSASSTKQAESKDPFDPDIFNKKYR